MKFAIATLFTLALALGVQSSVIPLGGVVTQIAGGPLAHTAVLSPLGLPLGGAIAIGHAPTIVQSVAPAAISLQAPAAIAVHAPAAIPAAIPAVVAGSGSYVAKTRGAIHTAPLAGHINSVANVNVAPAPGTI